MRSSACSPACFYGYMPPPARWAGSSPIGSADAGSSSSACSSGLLPRCSAASRIVATNCLPPGLMGVSEACYIPAALAMISDYHRGPTRSLATGLSMSGIYAGAALGGIGGYIAERFGWRSGFYVFGVFGIVYSAVLLLFLRDRRPDEDPADASQNVESAVATTAPPTGLASAMGAVVHPNRLSHSSRRQRSRRRRQLGRLRLAPNIPERSFQARPGAAGMSATGYIQVASFIGVLVAGTLADRWSQSNRRARAIIPALGYLVAGPCLFASASTNLLPIAIAGLVVFGLGRGAFDANQMPFSARLSALYTRPATECSTSSAPPSAA